jgi:predicted nicotinamide N-methyase
MWIYLGWATLFPGNPLPTFLSTPSDPLISRFAPLASVAGRPDLSAFQAPDVFALWHAWEAESGSQQDIPYWATVWPAALMLAEYLSQVRETVAGKTVLDLGCGGGIAGLAAVKAGAGRTIANDIDPVALWMAERNADANQVRLETVCGDRLGTPPDPVWDVILAADMFYEKTMAARMLAWLKAARNNGSTVFIADAGRPFSPRTGVRMLMEKRFSTDRDLEGTSERTVRLLAYLP